MAVERARPRLYSFMFANWTQFSRCPYAFSTHGFHRVRVQVSVVGVMVECGGRQLEGSVTTVGHGRGAEGEGRVCASDA